MVRAFLRFDGQTGMYDGVFAQDGGLLFSRQMAFCPDGGLFVASMDNNTIVKFDDQTGDSLETFNPVASPNGLAFGTDSLLYISSEDREVIVRYDVQMGAVHEVFIGALSGLNARRAWHSIRRSQNPTVRL